MSRTMTVTKISYGEARTRNPLKKALDVSDLPDRRDLLLLLHGLLKHLPDSALVNVEKKTYAKITELDPVGRRLLVSLECGHFGDPGRVVDVSNHQETHKHGDNEAHVVVLRALILVPLKSRAALMFVEHGRGRSAGGKLLVAIRKAWMDDYSMHTLHTETITRQDAWLQAAELEGVTATVYGHTRDVADQAIPSKLGDLNLALKPPKGERTLPRGLWDALAKHKLKRAELLGLPDDLEPDEVRVQVGDGQQTKMFVLGKETTPPVRYLLTDDGEPAMTDQDFVAFCFSEVEADAFASVGVQWHTDQNKGDWSASDLEVKWGQ